MSLKRVIPPKLIEDVSRREGGVIIGPPQVGKTTLLKAIQAHCRNQGIKCCYFDFEMPSAANFAPHYAVSIIPSLYGG